MKRKKPNLEKASRELDKQSSGFFGAIEVDTATLPRLTKPKNTHR